MSRRAVASARTTIAVYGRWAEEDRAKVRGLSPPPLFPRLYVMVKTPFMPSAACPGTVHRYG